MGELARGSALGGRIGELRHRSVLVATREQLTAALALLELDGVASRLILCPPDFPAEHLSYLVDAAAVDAVVFDQSAPAQIPLAVRCSPKIKPGVCDHRHDQRPDRGALRQTEWVLLTSGTTGRPKLVAHTLESLTGAIEEVSKPAGKLVWSTFYDIRRYGGLQIFLRASLTGASMVFSSATEPMADFLSRAGAHGVTHISGTPSHWRRELMSPAAHKIAPEYIRLSGEIADQDILNRLHSCYPQARIAHAFASTEAGVGFAVNDGLAGFPAHFVERSSAGVEMRVVDGSLRIRSTGAASRYLGREDASFLGADGFVDTGDMVELRGDRYYFVGRRDGVINVGGLKVHPEEVEAVINRHPRVRMSLVQARKNPLTGALVVADVVLEQLPDRAPDGAPGNAPERSEELRRELLQFCANALPRHKVPAAINIVPNLAVAATGKLARRHA
ncbi:MAG TPA: fatty acid--CoA ligase family protein [Candidatus Acidoferrales bacterium]|nr:fatty acid--CoA ligase family protein [Candidatus Acidoferrales bacterium]